jgi:penicillin-binding protein 1A
VALVISINQGLFGPLPDKYELQNIEHPVATEIYTADTVMIGKYFSQNRMDLYPHELKQEIIDAVIATEDIRFYNHNGIDVKSLFRVAIKTIMLQKDHSGGGSTISQQLAKNLYPRKNFPLGRWS